MIDVKQDDGIVTVTMMRAGVEPQETAADKREDLRADVAKAAGEKA